MKNTDVVIVGAAETDRIGTVPDMSAMALATSAAASALRQAGLRPADVDGVAGVLPVIDIAHALGVRPRWLDGTMVGGCSNMLHIRHAVSAIRDGKASVVVITHGQSGRSGVGAPRPAVDLSSAAGQFEMPYGVSGPFSRFTLPAMAYLAKYGHGEEALAEVTAAQSHWASRNPRAVRPDLLSVGDVLASRMVAWPFRVLECCPRCDGGGALVLTSAERARDMNLLHKPVRVAGTGESCEGPGAMFMRDLTSFRAFGDASRDAFADSGLSHADVDHLMIYDAFAHVPLYGLEDIGFAARGEAVDLIRSGATKPGGHLPLNTNGGGLLYVHTGMYGMFALQESVRQLQGRAAAQVEGASTSFVQGIGFMFGAAGSVILQKADA